MRSSRWLGLSFAAFGPLACASSPGEDPTVAQLPTETTEVVSAPRQGTGRFDGQVDDRAVAIADARFFVGPISSRDPTRRGLRIVLSDHAGVCQRLDVMRPGEQALRLEVELGNAPVGTGSYPVAAAAEVPTALARFDAMSSSCADKAFLAVGGAVRIEEADQAHIRGTFELTLGRNEVRGSFDAVPCEAATSPPLTTRCEP